MTDSVQEGLVALKNGNVLSEDNLKEFKKRKLIVNV